MNKKNNKFINSRGFLVALSILTVILLIAGVTYAWFTWSSTDNTNLNMTIGESTLVTFTSGNTISGNIYPVYNYTDGKSTTFTLNNTYTNTADKVMTMYAYLDITSIDDELKSSSFKYLLLDSSDNVLSDGDFYTYNSGDTAIVGIEFLPSGSSTYTFYVYLDGNNENSSSMIGKTIEATLRVEARAILPASTYITNLYLDNKDRTAENNEIIYQLASTKGLMNDRKADPNTYGLDEGNIRYYGTNPDNYIWLGDTYQSTYQFASNGETVTRKAGDKKLWRIIGVFDGKLKLIQADPISATYLSWDTSVSTVNSGYGINQWGPSGTYEGADLMRLLNSGYEDETVNNSLYWTKGIGYVYKGENNETSPSQISFVNTGLSNTEKNMIDTAVWYLGAYNGSASYANVQYIAERQSNILGKICTQGTIYCDDTVTRTTSWLGKVGLIHPSDYGYATDFTTCDQALNSYDNSSCSSKDWLFDSSMWQWTISNRANSSRSFYVFNVNHRGYVVDYSAYNAGSAHPAIYLKSGVTITGGTGTEVDPYVISS